MNDQPELRFTRDESTGDIVLLEGKQFVKGFCDGCGINVLLWLHAPGCVHKDLPWWMVPKRL